MERLEKVAEHRMGTEKWQLSFTVQCNAGKEVLRVYGLTVLPNLKMKVWACRDTCAPDSTYNLSCSYLLTWRNLQRIAVPIVAGNPVSMLNNYQFSITTQGVRVHNSAVRHRPNRSVDWCRQIYAVMVLPHSPHWMLPHSIIARYSRAHHRIHEWEQRLAVLNQSGLHRKRVGTASRKGHATKKQESPQKSPRPSFCLRPV